MKAKKAISLILALVMALGCMSISAWAEPATVNYNVWVGGTQITSANAENVFGDGKVSYNADTNTLTLSGYSSSGPGHEKSAIYANGDLNIVIVGTNSLTSTEEKGFGIYAGGSLVVTGSGETPTLNVTAANTGVAAQVNGESASFTGVTMAIAGARGLQVNEGHNTDELVINNCEITFASGTKRAIQVYNDTGDGIVEILNDSELSGSGEILVYGYGVTGGDALLTIDSSIIDITGNTETGRHGIELLSNYGDAVLTISNSDVKVVTNNSSDAINVGSQHELNGKGKCAVSFSNSSVDLSGNRCGLTAFSWCTSGNVKGTTVEITDCSNVAIVGGLYYGLYAYAYDSGDAAITITDSTVSASAPYSGVEMAIDTKNYSIHGSMSYTQTDSNVTLSGIYGLDVDSSSKEYAEGDGNAIITITGGTLTSTGFLLATGDTDGSVTMSNTDVSIDTTGYDYYPILTDILTIYSGNYTITTPDNAQKGDIIATEGTITGGTFNFDPTEYVPDGYTVIHNGDGTYTVVPTSAAKIGNTEYPTLAAAVENAQNGETVKLLDNVYEQIVIPAGKDITLDLNDHTITHNATTILVYGKLTVKDSDEDEVQRSLINSQGNCGITVCPGGELVFESGNVEAQEMAVLFYGPNATGTINGGEFSSRDNAVLGTNGSNGKGSNTITINGGMFNGSIMTEGYVACGIYAANNDVWNVNGGDFYITNGAGIVARAGVVNVGKDVSITTSIYEKDEAFGKVGDSSEVVPYSAIVFDAKANYPGLTEASAINITGGLFSSESAYGVAYELPEGNHSRIHITGGEFDGDPSAFVNTNNYTVTRFEDSFEIEEVVYDYEYWIVTDKNSVARIEGNGYATLEAAFAAAKDGDTITLLKSCSGNGIVVPQGKFNESGLTVDFGGYTYTVDGETVGSAGTETNGFQLLMDNNIAFENGTITSEKAKILVQNYSDLTLSGMTLTLNNQNYAYAYTLSNNNGDVYIEDSTINANPAGGFAFDVCRYASYPSVNVTVDEGSEINGNIEVYASSSDAKDGFSLTLIEGSEINGSIVLDATAKAAMETASEDVSIIKASSVEVAAPAGYAWGEADDDGYQALTKLPAIAKIGTTEYTTLKAAIESIEAGQSGTVELIADDVTLDINDWSRIYGDVTLDMKGKTITYGDYGLFNVKDGGKLTITGNGTITGPIGSDGAELDGYAMINVSGTGTLNYVNGTLTAGGAGSDGMYGVYVLDGATATFGDATAKTGPTITAHFAAIGTNFTTATANITVYGGAYTAQANPGNASTGWHYFCAPIYAACSGNYTISGGTFTGYYGLSTRYKDAAQTISISGGTFNTTSDSLYRDTKVGATDTTAVRDIAITGGTFSSDVNDYCADGYTATAVGSKWIVGPKPATPPTPVGDTVQIIEDTPATTITTGSETVATKTVTYTNYSVTDDSAAVVETKTISAAKAENAATASYTATIASSDNNKEDKTITTEVKGASGEKPIDSENTALVTAVRDALGLAEQEAVTYTPTTNTTVTETAVAMEEIVADLTGLMVAKGIDASIQTNDTVDVRITVEPELTAIEKTEATQQSEAKVSLTFDLTPYATAYESADEEAAPLTDSIKIDNSKIKEDITVTIQLPTQLQGRVSNVSVKHNGVAMDSEKITLNSFANTVTILTSSFSPYELEFDYGTAVETETIQIVGHTLELQDEIKINFYALVDSGLNNENYEVRLFFRGEQVAALAPKADGTYARGAYTGLYRYQYGVPAQYMNEKITLKLYDKNAGTYVGFKNPTGGSVAAETGYLYSVNDYLDGRIANSQNNYMVQLAKDTKSYGVYAKYYFETRKGTNPDAPDSVAYALPAKSAVLSALNDVTGYASKPGEIDVGFNYYASTLNLLDKIDVRMYFTISGAVDPNAYTFRIAGDGIDGYTDVKLVSALGMYYAAIPSIAAKHLDSLYTVSVYRDGTSDALIQYQYGPFNYVHSILTNSSNETLKSAVIALYQYNQSADNYFDHLQSN